MPILTTDNPKITALDGLHLYHAGMSPCSMRVRILLDELGLEWTSHEINLAKHENRERWFLDINPKGLIPALIDDGTPVTESSHIMRYLLENYGEGRFVFQDEALNREVGEWVDLSAQMHIKAIKTYIYNTTGGVPKSAGEMRTYTETQSDEELLAFHRKAVDGFTRQDIAANLELLADIFGRMESRLAHADYLVGDEFSMADMAMVPIYLLLLMVGFDFSGYPNIKAWKTNMSSRPAYGTAVARWYPKLPFWAMPYLMALRRLYLKFRIRITNSSQI